MNAGRLDRLINIRKTTSTARSTDGAPIMTVATRASNVWAEKRPITGRENFINGAIFYEADTLFSIRYSTAVTELCTIYSNGESYDIKKIIDPYDRNRMMEILARVIR